MSKYLEDLATGSPLIAWLFSKLPLLGKSLTLALIITWLAGKVFNTNAVLPLAVSIFVITVVITGYAPNVLTGVEHGLGFALAGLLLGFSFFSR
jgi:hypothetical protein